MILEQHRLLGRVENRKAAAQGFSNVGSHVTDSTAVGVRSRRSAEIMQKYTTEEGFILDKKKRVLQ